MISTQASRPKPGDRLRQHADNLRSGRLTWVSGAPVQKDEACMIVGGLTSTWWSTDEEERAINDVVRKQGSTSAVDFNFTHSLSEVVSALEAAADLLDKEGA